MGHDRQAAHTGAGAPRGNSCRTFDRSCHLSWERSASALWGGAATLLLLDETVALRSACSNSGYDRHPIFSSPHTIQTFFILPVQILNKSVLFWISTVIYVIHYLAKKNIFFPNKETHFLKTLLVGPFPARNLRLGIRTWGKKIFARVA